MSTNYDPNNESLDIECLPGRIPKLPRWVLTKNRPAFYDTESVTAIEMVARLYGKMQQLIDDYNVFIDKTNKVLDEQDVKIDEAVQYMKDNLTTTVTTLFNEALANGDITANLVIDYDSTTESLSLSIRANESEG